MAITHGEGPMMVLAGPGSGKTFVLTQRIHYLIHSLGISPEQILVITFTKLAAKEMKERFMRLQGEGYLPVTFATFHAFFFSILRLTGEYQLSQIITDHDKIKILRMICAKYQEFTDLHTELLSALAQEICDVKKRGIAPVDYVSYLLDPALFRNIYREYVSYTRQERKLDFDDLMLQCHCLLTERRDLLRMLQERYTYLLIDEFQDIEDGQFQIMRLLASRYRNLFVVGDDDQAIYGFRGASPGLMIDFPKIYPDAKTVTLKCNYRSTGAIVSAAQSVILENRFRIRKAIKPVKESGGAVEMTEYPTMQAEVQGLITKIKALKCRKGSVAVICRTSKDLSRIALRLKEEQIPFLMKEELTNPYLHKDATLIEAVLRFAAGDHRRAWFLKFSTRIFGIVDREKIPPLVDLAGLRKSHPSANVRRTLNVLEEDLMMITKLPSFAAINYMDRGMHLFPEKGEAFLLLSEMAKRHPDPMEYVALMDQLRDIQVKALPQQQRSVKITLLTMHASKGLEFDTVILPFVNEKTMPHHRAITSRQIEEERRLFYVAMTRAKEALFISYHIPGQSGGDCPSRFLTPLRKLHDCSKMKCNNIHQETEHS
ncbi:MAG: ATP-dependent helicase [Lachnospiraceae bacterium]|nr:ATP-dependent helicase [Lachnospiraceae bacterium]